MKKKCTSCNSEITQNYCPNCGKPSRLERINGRYIINEIADILSFEKGIFHTIKELALKPGESIRDFLLKDRNRLVKPVVFIIITSLIYTLTIHFFNIDDGYIDVSFEGTSHINTIFFQWVQTHYGYANMLIGLFIALWIKLFFKKYDYNIFEILILLCFLMGMTMLIFALFGLIEGLTHLRLMQFAGIIGLLYTIWGTGQFFKAKIINYIKAFSSHTLGMMTFLIVAIIIGLILDKIL